MSFQKASHAAQRGKQPTHTYQPVNHGGQAGMSRASEASVVIASMFQLAASVTAGLV